LIADLLILELDEDLDVGFAAEEFYVEGVLATGYFVAFVLEGRDYHGGLRAAAHSVLFGLAVGALCWLAIAVTAILGVGKYL
jgi:hypothetical protein